MKVSIKKLSEVTGFSPATVSNALNHKKGVNSDTSEKIFKAAESFGYQLEKPATKIRFVTYRKNGFIIDDSQIFPDMIEGVERQAKELGYETVFSHLNREESSFEEKLNAILEDKSSLVILLGTEMLEEDYELFKGYKGYLIILDGWCEEMNYDGVLINNTDAVCQAVEYLICKGHTEIGYLKGNYRIKSFQYREYGYQRTMRRHGLNINPEHIIVTGTQLETAYKSVKEYLGRTKDLPTAFFAENDVIAIGAMRALQEAGINIPEQVSIVGFDDVSFGAVSTPGLTTVRVFKQEMGEAAVRRSLDHIRYSGKNVRMKIQVNTQFVERESVRDLNRQQKAGVKPVPGYIQTTLKN